MLLFCRVVLLYCSTILYSSMLVSSSINQSIFRKTRMFNFFFDCFNFFFNVFNLFPIFSTFFQLFQHFRLYQLCQCESTYSTLITLMLVNSTRMLYNKVKHHSMRSVTQHSWILSHIFFIFNDRYREYTRTKFNQNRV